MPNISIDDARVLKDLLQLSRVSAPFSSDEKLTDIEQLHDLFVQPRKLDIISRRSPALVKKSKQILGVSRRRINKGPLLSPSVEAATENTIQVSSGVLLLFLDAHASLCTEGRSAPELYMS